MVHFYKRGCIKCKEFTNEDFILEANKIHNNLYEYPDHYINRDTKININCKIHGLFLQKPYNHLMGKGCKKCETERKTKEYCLTNEEFINRSNKIHNNKYEYIEEYKASNIKINIKCKLHGIFKQLAGSHLRGNGCFRCGKNISKIEIQWLNEIGIPDDEDHRLVKLKINNKLIKPDGYDPKTKTLFEFYGDYFHR